MSSLSHEVVLALAWHVSQEAALSYCPDELKYILALKRSTATKQIVSSFNKESGSTSGFNTPSQTPSSGAKSARDSAVSKSPSTSPAKSEAMSSKDQCRLCQEQLFFPVTLDCGQSHRFCFACLFNVLPALSQCPCCKQKVTRALNC